MGSVARPNTGSKDPSRLIQEVEAIVASGVGAFLVVCLLSYVPESPGVNHGGLLGFTIADILTQGFGYGAYVFPFALGAAGASLFLSRRMRLTPVRWVGACFLLFLVSVTLGVYRPHVAPEAAGGWVGGFLATLMLQGLGRGGSVVMLICLFLLDFMMITGHALSELLHRLARAIDEAFEAARQALSDFFRSVLEKLRSAVPSVRRLNPVSAVALPSFLRRSSEPAALEPRIVRSPAADGDDWDDDERPPARRSSPIIEVLRPRGRDKAAKRSEASQAEFRFSDGLDNFHLPPGNLLGKHDDRGDYVDEKALKDSSAILEQKLATFGVGGRVTAVRPGPVITTFEFEPEAGVKVSRVVNLCDDLTMALRAHGVRIVAPIPGKNCVGIEVSNKNRAVVGLRDLIDSNEFRDHRSALALALGRDTTGLPVFADLAKMPHLLMAGATGTGKSVALNTYILSVLYKATPHDVRFIMIDPKMLELSLYEGIPHLLVPVVTDVKKAAAALANVMREMDRRFELMKDKKVRSLDDYNRRIAEEKAAAEAEEARKPKARVVEPAGEEGDDEEGEDEQVEVASVPPGLRHEHLPRILVIIDELADLMMTVGREVESAVTRLAQKARAAGIHLIVATQRPSVDVITGLIKANFPSRISFQVTSRPDSRTILDTVGADRLLGNGDALYMAPGTSHLQRMHGGLVSDDEIKEIVEYLRKQGQPEYRMDILEGAGGEDGEDEDGEDAYDELYDRAVALVTQHGQGSTSWLQRKLGIGYNRSARIIEMMEREGVVGPSDGAKPRKVLVSAL